MKFRGPLFPNVWVRIRVRFTKHTITKYDDMISIYVLHVVANVSKGTLSKAPFSCFEDAFL